MTAETAKAVTTSDADATDTDAGAGAGPTADTAATRTGSTTLAGQLDSKFNVFQAMVDSLDVPGTPTVDGR